MKKIITLILCFSALTALQSQSIRFIHEKDSISAFDKNTNAEFGNAVDFSDDFVIVGSHFDDLDENGQNQSSNRGSVYFLKEQSGEWEITQKLLASDENFFDEFGYSVSMRKTCAFVGAIGEDHGSILDSTYVSYGGSVYSLEYDSDSDEWNEMNNNTKLSSPLRVENEFFGNQLDQSGEYVIIGSRRGVYSAPTGGTCGALAGTVIQVQPPDSLDYFFGDASFAIDNHLIIGVPWSFLNQANEDSIYRAGAAYLYNHVNSSWVFSKKFVAPERSLSAQFGNSVEVFNDYLFISGDEVVYVYKNKGTEWSLNQTITNPFNNGINGFGGKIKFDGKYLQIAAQSQNEYPDETNSTAGGAIYIFVPNLNDQFIFNSMLAPEDRSSLDLFPSSFANNGRDLFASIEDQNVSGTNGAGLLYHFSLPSYSLGTDEENELTIDVYPNPFSDYVEMKVDLSWRNVEVSIYDMSGRLVKDSFVASPDNIFHLQTGKLPSGAYTLVVQSDIHSIRRKLVKN